MNNEQEIIEFSPCMYCKKEAYSVSYYFDKQTKTDKVNFTLCKDHHDWTEENGMLPPIILNDTWMINLTCNKDVGL